MSETLYVRISTQNITYSQRRTHTGVHHSVRHEKEKKNKEEQNQRKKKRKRRKKEG